uniref:NADH-ubiquinone oxidoreductase chain 6 n=1 Tax=Aulorhynchus flavidus TaxID=240152 RepID=A7E1L6_9TELE|nr:NADH dehydrogenase subunit 6 [Aulorhynchus flavidus]BAF74910.1 ND6 [Aulorhynchus flavidus]
MVFVINLLMFGIVFGLSTVSSNPSPYFAALALVAVASMGCVVLVVQGGSFLSLILFLIYLGGMLVVFMYSAALAAEPYPEVWESWQVGVRVILYGLGVGILSTMFWEGWCGMSWMTVDELSEFSVFRGDIGGVALMYSLGGGMLLICGWALLLTLLVVLELTRGMSRGSIREI